MLKYKVLYFLLLFLISSAGLHAHINPVITKTIQIKPGEKWYGGVVDDGQMMPFKSGYSFNLFGYNKDNQSAPLLLSTKGRYIWSNQPFKFTITDSKIMITDALDSIIVDSEGNSLSAAFRKVSRLKFPASGKIPDPLLFSRPQYNTWIELVYNQNQTDILKYAHAIINNGFPPGVLMIDDNWMDFYGKFSFRKDRFPDPVQMVKELHQLGFKVMVWVCPFISSDTQIFRELNDEKLLLMSNKGNTKTTWSQAILDPAHFKAVKKSVALRMKYTPYILQTVKESAQTGEPVIRNLEYNFPGQGLEEIKNQFMMGKTVMVAPMTEKGTRRKIVFPKGKWLSETGKVFKGPITKEFDVALDEIPVFKNIL